LLPKRGTDEVMTALALLAVNPPPTAILFGAQLMLDVLLPATPTATVAPVVGVFHVLSPLRNVVASAVPDEPSLAVATVPLESAVALRFVRPVPLPVGVR